jgi:hypothetical protein
LLSEEEEEQQEHEVDDKKDSNVPVNNASNSNKSNNVEGVDDPSSTTTNTTQPSFVYLIFPKKTLQTTTAKQPHINSNESSSEMVQLKKGIKLRFVNILVGLNCFKIWTFLQLSLSFSKNIETC